MKIIVLDGYTLNPGDLNWKELRTIGTCKIYERTVPEKVIPRAKDFEIILTNKVILNKKMIARLPKLKYIGVLATGYNHVDIKAAQNQGITVTNVPTYSTQSVAQMVFSHILNFAQQPAHYGQSVQDGRWITSIDFCYWDRPLVELNDMVIGIIGLGRIGICTAQIARAFGMQVLAYHSSNSPPDYIKMTDLETLLKASDIVSLHCPLTAKTEKLINAERLALMKNTALLINTARGQLIDEQALAEALNQGLIAGAGLDVLSMEPPHESNPLIHADNCTITPHIAWATRAARERLLQCVLENLKAFLNHQPINVVNA